MESIRPWLGYGNVVPPGVSVDELLGLVRRWNRKEALRGLSVIAFELSRGGENSAGIEAEVWRLLIDLPAGAPAGQRNLASALAQLPHRPRIVHEQGVLTLQQLALSESTDEGRVPHDGELALALLCINDHLSAPARPGPASGLGDLTALLAFYHQFNAAFEVDMNFIVRVWSLFSQSPDESTLATEVWEAIQFRALGCLAVDYLEAFAFPLIVLSQDWGRQRSPLVHTQEWTHGSLATLVTRWFNDASLSLDEWRGRLTTLAATPPVIPRLTQEYLRTPMVRDEGELLVLSPSALKSHTLSGLWGRLNEAAKVEEPGKTGNSFRTVFGRWFENWARQVATSAKQDGLFQDHLLDTAIDEGLPDLVFRRGRLVVFVEVKVMIVPEDKLKTAETLEGLRAWLDDRLFAPRVAGKTKGGAFPQLDAAVRRLRAGDWRKYDLRPDSRVIPVLLTLDKLPGATALPGWVDQASRERGLLQYGDMLPAVSLGPFDFESLLSYAGTNGGVANLLARKVQSVHHRSRAFDQFLLDRGAVRPPKDRRLPSCVRDFSAISERTLLRIGELLGRSRGRSSEQA
jgi:hypothetical protein